MAFSCKSIAENPLNYRGVLVACEAGADELVVVSDEDVFVGEGGVGPGDALVFAEHAFAFAGVVFGGFCSEYAAEGSGILSFAGTNEPGAAYLS